MADPGFENRFYHRYSLDGGRHLGRVQKEIQSMDNECHAVERDTAHTHTNIHAMSDKAIPPTS